MSKSAKLFELEKGEQVLMFLEYHEVEDKTFIDIRTYFDSCVYSVKTDVEDQEEGFKFIENSTQEQAEAFRKESELLYNKQIKENEEFY